MATKRTIGVIGLGSIGMRHAKNLLAMGHEVRGYDPDKDRMTMLDDLGGLCDGSPHNVLGKSFIEAVVVASPSDLHYGHMRSALEAGKHVFIEKPIATKIGDRYARPAAPVTMVGYNLRFHSCVKKAKEWLDAGLIGIPLWANFTCAQHNDKYKDDLILNWSHEIDLALYLLGPAKVMACVANAIGHERVYDVADIVLTHEGLPGLHQTTIHLDYVTKPEQRGFTIAGSKGVILANLVDKQRTIILSTEDEKEAICCHDTYDENYVEEMQAFLDRIDGKETIGCTGSEGLAVLELCLEARKLAGLT